MKIIVVGCGRVGAALAQSMSDAGHDVTVVDVDPSSFDRLDPSFRGRMVQGVCFDRDVLLRAGIESADAFAAATSSDNANALAARIARDVFRVPRVVARIYKSRRPPIYERLGMQTVSSASWGAQQMEFLLTHPDFHATLTVGDVELFQMEIHTNLNGKPLSVLMLPGRTNPVSIVRGCETILPTADMLLATGDVLLMAIKVEALERVKAIYQSGQEA